ncbi:T9SS type A sorting domain-containing protein [Prolixibacteraceae bacterium JC049]|nr:T9SS type A sorting domain-containing protein [Prolixibacteraceae bacterium JC049]
MNKKSDKTTLPKNSRRDFIKTTALGAAALTFTKARIFAGPFNYSEDGFLIPADKKLSRQWIKSLYERGEEEWLKLSSGELQYVGMPVGGLACGQLYLAGDGRLRLWHIFKVTYSREKDHGQRFDAMTLGGHYAAPMKQFERETRPVDQGAAIRVTSGGKSWLKRLDARDFSDIQFRGEYPIGKVKYQDEELPVKVELEAFSPFIPNDAQESALPVTVLEYNVTNTSDNTVNVDLVSWLENAVLPYVGTNFSATRRNTLNRNDNRVTLHYTAEGMADTGEGREDIVFEDFESGSYQKWTVQGEAFGTAPFPKSDLKQWQPLSGYKGNRFINTHNTRDVSAEAQNSNGSWSTAADGMTGTLLSNAFTIERNFINFFIAGGSHNNTCLELVIDGKVVRKASGHNSNKMRSDSFDVKAYQGKEAQLRLVDTHTGGWGHISLDHIVFSDSSSANTKVEDQHGFGSMAISLIDNESSSQLMAFQFNPDSVDEAIGQVKPIGSVQEQNVTQSVAEKLTGALGKSFELEAGKSKKVRFMVSWFFPYLNNQDIETGQLLSLEGIHNLKRHYFKRFNSALQVADYVQLNAAYLIDNTKLWNKTWYDSSLPYWLLDRSFIPIDCLASNTVVWFDNDRFWAWEGVECCPGTCQHVWHYAQGMARVFPELERWLRENRDLGAGMNANGSMAHRDETAGGGGFHPAHDGHCGTIIRIYREHRMTSDNAFLERNYANVKRAIRFIINEDKNKDGLLEGGQTNTLDAAWYGPMGWISSLYLGALAVGIEMAEEMNDGAFASECEALLRRGQKNIVSELYNGEYFIHKPDKNRPNAINSNDGCLIDQVLGQSLAMQAGYNERIIPETECKSALNSIWKYNFAPDAFWYQKNHKPIKGARIYATEGEAGTLMCTWPKGGAERAVPGMANWPDESATWLGPGGYFDECMNGFEYQAASHLIFEDEVEKGLAITKAVHERYGALKRNPYNEIECGDHYSRSMASYGVFVAACGFRYHGPKGELTFSPKWNETDFKAPFTVAEGWGTFSQKIEGDKLLSDIVLKYGKLKLTALQLNVSDRKVTKVEMKVGDNAITTHFTQSGNMLNLTFDSMEIDENDNVVITSVLKPLQMGDNTDIIIYPNPFLDRIQIKSDAEWTGVSIVDMEGHIVYNEDDRFFEKEANLDFLPKGTYVVQLKSKTGISTRKITKG